MSNRLLVAAAVVVAAFAATGCATTTMITSDPPGATVSRNGQNLGTTPLRYESKMWIWETEHVDVTSTTGATASIELRRSEIDALPFAGSMGLVCCFGLTVVGLVGIPLYMASAWKLPATTVVNFPARPAQERARKREDDDELVAFVDPGIVY